MNMKNNEYNRRVASIFPACWLARCAALALLLSLSAGSASAVVRTNGDFQNSAGGTVTLLRDVTFEIMAFADSTGFDALTLVLDEAAAPNTGRVNLGLTGTVHYTKVDSAGASTTGTLTALDFDDSGNRGDMTSHDAFLTFNMGSLSLSAGDIFTIHASTSPLTTTSSHSLFNPAYNDFTFSGNMFLARWISGNRISNSVVPEPSTYALLLGGSAMGFVFSCRRRRRG